MLHREEPYLLPATLLRYLDQGYYTPEVCEKKAEDDLKRNKRRSKQLLITKYNTYYNPKLFDEVFGKSVHFHKENSKTLLLEIINGKPYIFINKTKPHIVPYIRWINHMVALGQMPNNLELTVLSAKFRCQYSDGSLKHINNILGVAHKEGYREIPFLPYYVVEPYWVCRRLKGMKTKEAILEMKKKTTRRGDLEEKCFFRGSINNELRKVLFEKGNRKYLSIDEDGKDFLDSCRYKYILDVNGLDGHSGRRYWLTHMKRLLFVERHDDHKLFFELENGIRNGIHYESFDVNDLSEMYEKIRYYEKNDDKYKQMVKKLSEFNEHFLSYRGLVQFSKDLFERLQGKNKMC